MRIALLGAYVALFASLATLDACGGPGTNLSPSRGSYGASPAIFQGVDPDSNSSVGSGYNTVNIQNGFQSNQFYAENPLHCTAPGGGIFYSRETTALQINSSACTITLGDAIIRKTQCDFKVQPLRISFQGAAADCSAIGNVARWNLKAAPSDILGGPPKKIKGPDDTPGGMTSH